jgi:hypothetical protein
MTGRVLTVALDPGDAGAAHLHRTVLASLTGYFRLAASPAADVQIVSGDRAGWYRLAQSAVASGVRAITLTGTKALTAEAVHSLSREAAARGAVIAADTAYAADPSWTEALPLLAAGASSCAVLDSVVTVPRPHLGTTGAGELRAALVEQLAVVRPLLTDLTGLQAVHVSSWNYALAGMAGGVTVTLSGVISGTGDSGLSLDLVGTGRRWQVRFEADALASPTRISACDLDGEHIRAPVFESAHRAAWMDLHHAVTQRWPLPRPVGQLAADLATAEAALPGQPVVTTS